VNPRADLYIHCMFVRDGISKGFPCLLRCSHRLRVRCVRAPFPSVLSSRTRSWTFTMLKHLLENVSSPVGRVFNHADHLVKLLMLISPSRSRGSNCRDYSDRQSCKARLPCPSIRRAGIYYLTYIV